MNSIRNRLLLWQSAAILLVVVVVGLITLQIAWDGFNRVRDYTLEQIAHSIHQYGVEPIGSPSDGQFVSQIWDADGTLKFTTHPELKLPRQLPGVHLLAWRGEEWHIYTMERDAATVQVANTTTNRSLMFSQISLWLLLPLGLLIGLLGGLLAMVVRKSLQPLNAMRDEISACDPEHLVTLPAASYPSEIAPLAAALNNLLSRLDQVLGAQRRFVADAAHELRTPLTAIRLQSQIALACTAAEERRAALETLLATTGRATRLVEQLLQLARCSPEATRCQPMQPLRLDELARQLVVEYADIAETYGIDLGLLACDAAWVRANPAGLHAMLGNLIDNALRYGRRGGQVDVEVRATGETAVLMVGDNGPGIPDRDKPLVFERFHRLAGPETSGSGLGLAIVREVVLQHGGQVSLQDAPGGGLGVFVSMPLCAPGTST